MAEEELAPEGEKKEKRSSRSILTDVQHAERSLAESRFGEVEAICIRVLEDDPENRRARQMMVEVRLARRDMDEALRQIRELMDEDPYDARHHNLLGRYHNNLGFLDPAEECFRDAIDLKLEYPDAWNNLGHVLRRREMRTEAQACFRKALTYERRHGLANINLGSMMFEEGHLLPAIKHLQLGLQREMTHLPGQYNLALALHELGRFDEAIAGYRRLLAAGQQDADVYSNLGSALQAAGDTESAVTAFRCALQKNPGHGPAVAGVAGILEVNGHLAEAERLLVPFIDQPGHPPAIDVAYANVLKRTGRSAEALLRLAPVAKQKVEEPAIMAPVHYVIGDLLDERGDHDRAFAHYARANQLRRAQFSEEVRHDQISRLMTFFARDRFDILPRTHRDTESPVFIVGMPRSGTSLIEEIIAAHPEAYGCGELREVTTLAIRASYETRTHVPYPDCLEVIGDRKLYELSGFYLTRLYGMNTSAIRFTDKMWQNYEHLGFIQMMFPQAHIIHCRRDPVDTGVSCFVQSFGTAGPPFSYDLAHIGQYYNEYMRLMDHWHRDLDVQILDLNYEDVVQKPEETIRGVLDFIGLDWHPACMSFYENKRQVRTASHLQVRQPIYTNSVGNARRFLPHLGPLLEALDKGGNLPGEYAR